MSVEIYEIFLLLLSTSLFPKISTIPASITQPLKMKQSAFQDFAPSCCIANLL